MFLPLIWVPTDYKLITFLPEPETPPAEDKEKKEPSAVAPSKPVPPTHRDGALLR